MQKEIKGILGEVLELGQDKLTNITFETDLAPFGVDSITAVQLVIFIEAKFDITIDDTDYKLENFSSIKAICSLVDKYKERV